MRDIQTIIRMATLLNDSATVQDYTIFYAKLVDEFNRDFYNSTTIGYADGMQAANVLALALPDVVSDAKKPSVLAALVADINARGHLTCGIVSVAYLFPLLSANGHHDLALKLAQQTSYPSYGWMFTNEIENATTLWERWDSPMESPFSNSRNHIMYGSIGAWFYRYVAGIELNGLENIVIRPRQSFNMTLMPTLHAELVTVKGAITVEYERRSDGSEIELIVGVPMNTVAEVVMEPLVEGGICRMIRDSNTGAFVYQHTDSGSVQSHTNKHHRLGVHTDGVSEVVGVFAVHVDKMTGAVSIHVSGGGDKYRFIANWE